MEKDLLSQSVQAGEWIGVERLSLLVSVGTFARLLVGLLDGESVPLAGRRVW